MSRLTPLDPNHLSAEQQQIFDAMKNGPRGGRAGGFSLVGPYDVWVRAQVGDATQALGASARFHTDLTENIKEVAICTVGAHYQARFEFAAHARLAAAAGVDEACVERLRLGEDPQLTDPDERMAWRVASALLTSHQLPRPLYDEALTRFSETQLIELVTVIGYYCLVSLTLNAFDIPLAAGMRDPFPRPAP